jgi:protein-L-isoaspartate O-methyltransferase
MKASEFLEIKNEYDKFRRKMLSQARFLVKDTGIGFWGISHLDDIYTLFKKIKLHESKHFLDLGSGDGRVSIIASLFTKSTGIEFDDELHNFAINFKEKLNSNAKFYKKDYLEHSLEKYDVVFINPDKRFDEIEGKLATELKGKLIVYGTQFHPLSLKKVQTFNAHTTPVTIYES